MAKLYLFGIGGTGSRVIKSLTMLLAAGVKPVNNEINEIVPIIIDPHKANEDLKRTLQLISDYQRIYDRLGDNRTGFFSTKISQLNDSLIQFQLEEVNQLKFEDYISYSTLDKNNHALASLLFSKETLEVEMDIGFVGNPNIGSVVLNQFTESDEFRSFASNFSDGDRIFIISSIFGGTGAAGFPLLVKNFRNANAKNNNYNISQKDLIANAPIGAVSVLPYFGVSPNPDKAISKSDFFVKTKAALAYYEKNLSGGSGALNAHYYIGDIMAPEYENDPGENGQKNDAHFIEVAAALSIVEFMNLEKQDLPTSNGKAKRTIHHEFGIKSDVPTIHFEHLGADTQEVLAKPLTKYFLFKQFLKKELKNSINRNEPFTGKSPELNSSFTSSSFYKNFIRDFNRAFDDWLTELENNKRGFKPFNQNATLDKSIVGVETKSGWFKGKFDYKYFVSELNKAIKNETYASSEEKLMRLFNDTLDSILKSKFDYFN